MATDGKIQHDEEWLVEHPLPELLRLTAGDHVVDGVVDEELDLDRIPFDGKDVEVVGEGPAVQREAANERCSPRVPRTVHGRAGGRDIAAVILHYVELTALRPRRRGKIATQHPERGPETLTGRQLDARLHASGGRVHFAARIDLGGCVAARTVVTVQPRRSEERRVGKELRPLLTRECRNWRKT